MYDIKKIKSSQQKKINQKNVQEKHLSKPTSKKLKNEVFVDYMDDKKIKKQRLEDCGNFLRFIRNAEKTAHKLAKGQFCNNRFCPMCSWLKAKKMAFGLLELIEYAKIKENKAFIFITLTAPNVKAKDLTDEITDFNLSFKRFTKLKDIIPINKGYIRKLEVTYNKDNDTYHPHFHILMAVNKSYFTSRDYIKREKMLKLWQASKRDESITQVDVRKAQVDTIAEIMEIATYSAKQKDLYDNGKSVFDIFYKALRGRQVITYNGLFKDLKRLQRRKELDLSDLKNLDTIKTKATHEIIYLWQKDIKQYVADKTRELTQEEIQEFYNFDIDFD